MRIEAADSGVPLTPFVSTKSLVADTNTIDLLVGLTPETQPGVYKFKVHLVTDKIGESAARIPITFEITVSSLFHYLVKLVAFTFGIAVLIFFAIVAPWKRASARNGSLESPGPNPPADETDQMLA